MSESLYTTEKVDVSVLARKNGIKGNTAWCTVCYSEQGELSRDGRELKFRTYAHTDALNSDLMIVPTAYPFETPDQAKVDADFLVRNTDKWGNREFHD